MKNADELTFGDNSGAERYHVFKFQVEGLNETRCEDIKCAKCPTWFLFTEGEQDFYAVKSFNRPKLCKACKEARNEERTLNNSSSKPKLYKSSRQQGKHKQRRGKRDNSKNGKK